VKNDIWVLDTTGTNLMEALSLDYIDTTRTLSNDIREIYDVLGIEAARQMINNEMMDVMEFSGVYTKMRKSIPSENIRKKNEAAHTSREGERI
jgi:DNA-directed RNA polymerase II subunit RPB1